MDAGYAHQRLLPDVREMSKVPGPAMRSLDAVPENALGQHP